MNETKRHDRVTQLFLAACELPQEKRASFLNQQCADHPELIADVETMLQEDSRNPHFLETPALGEGLSIEPDEVVTGSEHRPVPMPSRIGAFKVLEVLGEGGMGIVYLAEQDNPRRRVALKVIRPGIASEGVFKRFEHESHILGRLQHPGVAQIFDAGMADTEGGRRPYFAMEYVKGVPLTKYAETHELGTRDRLTLMGKVCDAVHHAHQKGIIHRDLKPGNILVDESGQPKILDFGVARATDSDIQATTMRTDVGQLIGTISYMSPEQIEGDPDALDTRSDVYALGVICYKLLTGRLPYDLRNRVIHEATRVICDDDPTPMSSVNHIFRGDVETIVHKALEKDRERRYQSSSDLGADIGHYVRDEPIVARPASAAYQLRKFARRNRALVIALTAVILALMIGVIATSWALVQANRQREHAELNLKRACDAERLAETQSGFLRDVLTRARPDRQANADITLREVLKQAAKTLDDEFPDQPMAEAALRGTLGLTFLTLRDFPDAEVQLRRQRKLSEAAWKPDDPHALENAHYLARALVVQNRLEEAAPLLEQSLAYLRKSQGIDNIDTLGLMLTYARYWEGARKTQKAEKLYMEILDTVRRIRSDDHPLALICKAELGDLYERTGRLEEAEELLTEVLQARRSKFGSDHKDTLTAMNNLAKLYLDTREYEQAKNLLLVALAGQRKIWGENTKTPLICQMNLVKAHMGLGQYDEAKSLCQDALARSRTALGPDYWLTQAAVSTLAVIDRTQGK